MIPPKEWSALIQGTLERLASSEYQRKAWFNRHLEESSPEELINQLIDDLQFAEFMDSPLFGFSADQKRRSATFQRLLEGYGTGSGPLSPLKTLNDPRWGDIQRAAGALTSILFG